MQSPHASTAPINKPPHATQARILDDDDALPQTAFVHEVHALAEWNACPTEPMRTKMAFQLAEAAAG
jgi:hypothetical protein